MSLRLAAILPLVLLSSCAAERGRRPAPPPSYAVPAIQTSPQEDAPASELAGVGADLRAAPGRLWDDTRVVFSSPRSWLFLAGAGLYGLAQENWEEQEEEFFENHTLFSSAMQDVLGFLGNGATLYAGVLTWYFTALARDDASSYEASKTTLSAMTLTAISTGILKATVQDGRPSGGGYDFPSGHASMSMATAAALDALYGRAIGWPAYGLAFLVGLQRLDIEKHDTGAVVFGWTLGYVIGHTVATHHAPRIFGMELGVVADPDSGAYGLSLTGGL